MRYSPYILITWALVLSWPAFGRDLDTNAVFYQNAPPWLTASLIERVVDRIQSALEWDIRKVQAYGYTDQTAFQKIHGYDETVLAFARKKDLTVHLGPRVTRGTFESVFGHELVHIIVYQKYGGAIPPWLDEGLANVISKHGKVDYRWLASQPYRDVQTLAHPFTGAASPKFSYMAATAVMEMIQAKCDLEDLLQLSVGKDLRTYLATTCNISDINVEFQNWLKKKTKP